MVEHSASVLVKAPVQQVYELFTHFNDFPKFMSFVKEVTYYDDQRSHWVVNVLRDYDWDAVNEDWVPGRQVGWRSTRGLRNSGKVKFRPLGPERTIVDVYIQYVPPSGPLGQLGEKLGVSAYFDEVLKKDLDNFARMVEEAPPGALDPMSSHYLFHSESAASRNRVTSRQQVAMAHDPMMTPEALAERQARIERETELRRQQQIEQEKERRIREERERQLLLEQKALLEREATRRQQELRPRQKSTVPLDPRYTHAAIAQALGDRDGLRARNPNFTRDPMTSRRPLKPSISAPPPSDA